MSDKKTLKYGCAAVVASMMMASGAACAAPAPLSARVSAPFQNGQTLLVAGSFTAHAQKQKKPQQQQQQKQVEVHIDIFPWWFAPSTLKTNKFII